MKLLPILFACSTLLLVACNTDETSQDKTKDIDKTAALETSIAVAHLDSTHDVITTTYNTWVANNNTKQIVHNDTIASLGYGKIEATDQSGNAIEKIGQKDYEIFITVK